MIQHISDMDTVTILQYSCYIAYEPFIDNDRSKCWQHSLRSLEHLNAKSLSACLFRRLVLQTSIPLSQTQ